MLLSYSTNDNSFFRIVWYLCLFNGAVSTSEFTAPDIRMNKPNQWIGKDEEGNNRVLNFGTISAFNWSGWRKPREISVLIIVVPAHIRDRNVPNTVEVAIFGTFVIKGLPYHVIFRILESYSLINRYLSVSSRRMDRPIHLIWYPVFFPYYTFDSLPITSDYHGARIHYLKRKTKFQSLTPELS
jgi:hypothetical protein